MLFAQQLHLFTGNRWSCSKLLINSKLLERRRPHWASLAPPEGGLGPQGLTAESSTCTLEDCWHVGSPERNATVETGANRQCPSSGVRFRTAAAVCGSPAGADSAVAAFCNSPLQRAATRDSPAEMDCLERS